MFIYVVNDYYKDQNRIFVSLFFHFLHLIFVFLFFCNFFTNICIGEIVSATHNLEMMVNIILVYRR